MIFVVFSGLLIAGLILWRDKASAVINALQTIALLMTGGIYWLIYDNMNRGRSEDAMLKALQYYASHEMGDALKELWDMVPMDKRGATGLDDDTKQGIAAKYMQEYESLPNPELHWKRRKVTYFFLMLRYFHQKEILQKDTILEVWTRSDFRIVFNILVPIEKELANRLQSGQETAIRLSEFAADMEK